MPFAVMYLLSDIVAFMLYHIVRYRRRVVRDNLKRCFPHRSEKEIIKIEKDLMKRISSFKIPPVYLS